MKYVLCIEAFRAMSRIRVHALLTRWITGIFFTDEATIPGVLLSHIITGTPFNEARNFAVSAATHGARVFLPDGFVLIHNPI